MFSVCSVGDLMNFILKMAWRDTRAGRRRLLLFSLSIVLGVAALVAIGSLCDNLRRAVDGQAKTLLGADLALTSRAPLPAEVKTYLDGLGGEQAREIAFSSMIVFPGRGGRTRIVQVRALEGGFPFYGDFVTDPAGARAELAAGDRAILEDTLLRQFGVGVGDTVKLGGVAFTIAGALKKAPGESLAVALLAPRVYVPWAALPRTGLLGPGSLVRYRTYVKLPPGRDAEAVVRAMRERFAPLRLEFDTVAGRKRELGRTLDNVAAFLNLAGLAALLLGAVGVGSAMHGHIRQKLGTIAVLRCLGATAPQSFLIYLLQGLGLGAAGAGLGAALGVAVQLALPVFLKDWLPFPLAVFVSWPAVARGLAAGLAVCLLFVLQPLLAVRRVPPLAVLRRGAADETAGRFDPWRAAVWLGIAAAVTAVAIESAGAWRRGLAFAAALPYVWRQGIANLHRPHNRTALLLLALGLGTFLVLTLDFTRATLLAQIRGAGGAGRPNLIFFDIQSDQVNGLDRLLAREGAPLREQAPIVTMRIAELKGRAPAELLRDRNGRTAAWALRRDYRSTYRDHLTDTETLVAGKFTGRVERGAAVVPVSIEEGLARDLGLKLGDQLTFDVQGVPVRAAVGSLRRVEWRRMEPNFFVVFPAGVLEGAPQTYVAAARAATPADSARAQTAAVSAYPNVSAIDLGLVLQTLDGIFSKAAFVVNFLALFTALTGVIVLAGAVLTGRFQRLREVVLLRTLGATRGQLRGILVAEYAVLGVLAAATGGGCAAGAAALLAKYIFQTSLVAPPGVLLAAAGVVTAVTLITGLLSNRGVCNHPPLEALRRED